MGSEGKLSLNSWAQWMAGCFLLCKLHRRWFSMPTQVIKLCRLHSSFSHPRRWLDKMHFVLLPFILLIACWQMTTRNVWFYNMNGFFDMLKKPFHECALQNKKSVKYIKHLQSKEAHLELKAEQSLKQFFTEMQIL